jgi:putative FmdB family regulatory protein
MPIYAYRCANCGHAKDVLQKISDPALTVCPACGAESFAKQVTAAGFQLKGSGWYVTDFKGSGAATAPAPKAVDAPAAGGTETGTSAKPSDSGTSASAPSSGCGSSCACH